MSDRSTVLKLDDFTSQPILIDSGIGQGDPPSMSYCTIYNSGLIEVATGPNERHVLTMWPSLPSVLTSRIHMPFYMIQEDAFGREVYNSNSLRYTTSFGVWVVLFSLKNNIKSSLLCTHDNTVTHLSVCKRRRPKVNDDTVQCQSLTTLERTCVRCA